MDPSPPTRRAEPADDADTIALVEAWAAGDGREHSDQRPDEELLAEHQLMRVILTAMEHEARDLLNGAPLRPDFWSRVVDFIGNFVHRVHRVKEERWFFPQLIEQHVLEEEDRDHLRSDHARLRNLTQDLCNGVGEGDWEKALRVVSHYLQIMRAHLQAEEVRMNAPEVRDLDAGRMDEVRRSFDELNREVLQDGGRAHYLEIVRSLRKDTGGSPSF